MPQTVLIVDDHAGFREFARSVLDGDAFNVIGEAEDGESALVAARRLDPDVVLLDVALPDLDGFVVCDRLIGAGGRPAVVMTSSRDVSSLRWALGRSRARGFVAKVDLSPATVAELVA